MIENYSLHKSNNRSQVKQMKSETEKKQQVKTIFGQIPSILLTTLLSIIGFGLGYTAVAIAQEYPGCFLLDEFGNRRDLTISVCGLFGEELPEEVSTSTATAGLYEIPIKSRSGGIPVIDVTFNGNQTYEMLLDTGATGTSITQEMANSLKVIPNDRGTVIVADGRKIEKEYGIVASISAGGLELKQFRVGILAPEAESALLGQDFFGNYDMTVKEKVVELKVRSSS
ncbi:TIGR02281 family clan AA aspartic protease [Okeania sp. SIO3B5]|uniref:retropepsin-like aspartic protease family protein n=1 Tax=Okeania sp. SIO3B5 TaxID=2607811 RepID=UPI0025F0B38E|nr:retropepsin-like aspartic protease [Okeania sp. SIO3B5]